MGSIFFDGWDGLLRILITAPVMYAVVVVFVRLAGKRSTSQMNNFDWVVTVALGSIVGSAVILRDVTIAEASLAIAVLFGVQWMLTAIMPRSELVSGLVKAEPRLLVENGEFRRQAMLDERVTKSEIRAALRRNGLAGVSDAQWVILESDARLSVIPKGQSHEDKQALRPLEAVADSSNEASPTLS